MKQKGKIKMYIQKTTDAQNKAHAIRVKLLSPANQAPQGDVAVLQRRLRNANEAIGSLKREVDARDAEIAQLRLDMADRNARILAQAKRICEMHDEDEMGEMQERRSVKEICRGVLVDYPGVSVDDVISVRRNRELIVPRQKCYLAVYNERKDLSLTKMGHFFKRDHSTLHHGIKKLGGFDHVVEE